MGRWDAQSILRTEGRTALKMHAANNGSAVRTLRTHAGDTAGRSVPALYTLDFRMLRLETELFAFMLTGQRRFSLPIY